MAKINKDALLETLFCINHNRHSDLSPSASVCLARPMSQAFLLADRGVVKAVRRPRREKLFAERSGNSATRRQNVRLQAIAIELEFMQPSRSDGRFSL